MRDIDFPIFKTKLKDSSKKFDLTDFNQRQAYFQYKAGPEIEKLKKYLKENLHKFIHLSKIMRNLIYHYICGKFH